MCDEGDKMSLKIQTVHFRFDRPGTQSGSVDFHNNVRAAGASIQGFETRYAKDQWLEALKCKVINVSVDNTIVTFVVEFDMHDSSQNRGEGSFDVQVIADVEASSARDTQEPTVKIG